MAFALSALSDFVAAVHLYALSHDRITLALFFGSLIPFASLYSTVVLIESKTLRDQLAVTAFVAAGVVVGTLTTLLLFR